MRIRQVLVTTVLAIGSMMGLGCGEDPSEQVKYYFYRGTNMTRSPDGQVMRTGETLLRRTFDGPNSQIIEYVVTKDDSQGVQENTLTFVVKGSTLKDDATGFTGDLKGESWEWTEWTARGTLPNGLMVESTSTIHPDNVTVGMKFKDGDTLQFTVTHEVTAIPHLSFDRLLYDWSNP